MAVRRREIREFGDFQTPPQLAGGVCSILAEQGLAPVSILEPTCGEGNFLVAALQAFPTIQRAVGVDINPRHIARARAALPATHDGSVDLRWEDFFNVDWATLLASLSEPLLIIGNPPWVTNAALSTLGSSNLPIKFNLQKLRGIDAVTGKSNFDISESMLLKTLGWISGKQATVAMLCKTTVARKVLAHAWQNGPSLAQADIYHIDAMAHFGAAVDACLLVITASETAQTFECRVHNSLNMHCVSAVLGYSNDHLLANVEVYQTWKHLEGSGWHKWRSGIKHDCTRVMELRERDGLYRNGLGETVNLETDYIYPMLKSSDVANTGDPLPSRHMIVPQRFVGEETGMMRQRAPKTWEYLENHADSLERRASSIYRNRPRFSIFGVGEYSFAPWKVAVSGFYKNLRFRVVGPSSGKPVVLDDTCYFIACRTQEEATCIAGMLNSSVARDFFSAFIFWDSKRPVTVELLKRLDLLALAKELGVAEQLIDYRPSGSHQLPLV